PAFANYINTRDFSKGIETDAGPEGLEFIPATESPTDLPLLLVANEVGGTVAVLQLNVTKVTLDKSELALAPGGEGAKLTAAVTPVGDSAPTVTWTSSNSSIAEVDANGFVKPGS
ncbi:Ig-like domain-containing protein, partial [Paenibacillus sepulcri]|nr:Ig-like domain-containing protein [Paenibacillus sepulcri]